MLRAIVPVLRDLPGSPIWTFGGGTSLAIHYDHRISYDIDIFVESSRVIRDLTPARNAEVRKILGDRRYEYPGNYLKLNLEDGEIDIIVAVGRTDTPTCAWDFEGTEIRLDTPWETAIKKLFHRPSTFTLRDVFDLAAVIDRDGPALQAALPEVADRLDKVRDRIGRIAAVYADQVREDINPTASGRKYLSAASPETVLRFLAGTLGT